MNYIVQVSKRGQITIPKEIRIDLGETIILKKSKINDSITLESLKTKEDFLLELDEISEDFKINGGLNIELVKKKLKKK